MTEQSIIGVQFSPVGKIYHFSVPEGLSLEKGSFVLVNTARGRQLGKVLIPSVQNPHNTDEIQPIERVATQEDLELKEKNAEKEKLALEKAREHLKDPRYSAVKAFAAEYSYDGNRLTFFLNYEPAAGFDIRTFLREISRSFRDVRLEVRQVGPRDMAKALSGLGACGIEKRCCSKFLTEFSSISIKMAKSQDISLTPTEITGMCGRLRCCLNYEYETYEEARKNLPKRKKIIQTPLGEGKVIQVLPMSDSVIVELPENGRVFSRWKNCRPENWRKRKTYWKRAYQSLRKPKAMLRCLLTVEKPTSESSRPHRDSGNRQVSGDRGGDWRGTQQGSRQNPKTPTRLPSKKEIQNRNKERTRALKLLNSQAELSSPKEEAEISVEQADNWPAGTTILVILAHPDDPEFFLGGAIARWTAAGHTVKYGLLTKGERGISPDFPDSQELARLRVGEQTEAAAVLGVHDITFLDYQDGYLVPSLEIRREVTRLIRSAKPDIVVSCDPQNYFIGETYLNHPDHRAAGQLVVDAIFPAVSNPSFFPELLEQGYPYKSIRALAQFASTTERRVGCQRILAAAHASFT